MNLSDFGLIGLAVMGENLVLNLERNGFKVAVYNRTTDKVENFVQGRAKNKQIKGCYTLEELVSNLQDEMVVRAIERHFGVKREALTSPMIRELRETALENRSGRTEFALRFDF